MWTKTCFAVCLMIVLNKSVFDDIRWPNTIKENRCDADIVKEVSTEIEGVYDEMLPFVE